MSEFAKVSTAAELALLDDDDVIEGYCAGLDSDKEPGSDKSRAYWHGWRNAQTDRGRAPVDEAQQRLARELYPRPMN
jgi:hypothetical protein